MKLYLKYGLKVGNTFIPKGTEVSPSDIKDVRKIFPEIDYQENSHLMAIKILDSKCFLVLKREIEIKK